MKSFATLVLLVVAGCTAANPNYIADAATGGDDMAMSGCARICPNRSSCVAKLCSPPAPEPGTQIGERCDANGGPQQLQCSASLAAMLSCEPFISPTSHEARWYCDNSVGTGDPSVQCGSGGKCRTGFCASNGHCFWACQQSTECAAFAGYQCRDVTITVDGISVTAKSCGP